MNYIKKFTTKYSLRQKLLIASTCIYLFTLFVFVEREETLIYSKIAFLFTLFIAVLNINLNKIYFTQYDLFLMCFTGLCFASVLWSPLPDKSLEMSITLLQLFVLFVVFRISFRNFGDEFLFVEIISVAGLGMCLFYLYFYGIIGYINAMSGNARLGNEFQNTNTIGGACAFVFLSFLYLGIKKNKIWFYISVIPAIVMLGAGSRTGIAVALCGIACILINYLFNSNDRNAFKKVILISVIIALFVYVIFNASEIGFLNSTYEHFKVFFDAVSGKTATLGSVYYRIGMLRVGFELFISHPIFGNGINATKYALFNAGIPYTVLHNNFIELLADVGIVGFSLYYGIYFISLKRALKQIKSNSFFPLLLLVMMLVLDIGGVTYYMQRNYLFLVFVTISLDNDSDIGGNHIEKRYFIGYRHRRNVVKN